MWSVVNYIDESNSLNNYAVSSDGIATALKDSASALMEGGNNLEQATALVAAANRVVQDPNSVGSALRTISLRLRGTSVEILEEMGEETDGVVESTSKLQEKLKALTGVDILTDAGAYKDTYTILKEIGEVWQNLDTMDQAAALELIAGKNRANTLAAILNNMKDLEGAYESAMDAEGSAMRENEAYLDSIQGRVDLFTNALQTLWMNLLKSDMIKGIVDAGTLLIQLLDTGHGKIMAIIGALMVYAKIHNKTKFSDMFKGTVEVLTKVVSGTKEVTVATVAEALAAKKVSAERVRELLVKSGLAGIDGQLTNGKIKVAAATLTEALRAKELTAAQYLAAMSSMGLKTALKGLWNVLKANPIMLAATAVTVLALAFDQFHTTAQEAADTAREAFDEIQNVVEATKSTIQSLESELSTIQDKIDELDGKKLSFAEDQELKKLKKQRAELEHSLKVQQQLLELQRNSSSKQAIASMKAYTKATSEGAKETQDTAKTWGTIGGIVLGIAGALLAIPSGGTSLGMTVAAVGAGGVAGGFAGNKVGEAIGSGIAANEGTYDSWYETYTKALDAARKDEQKALENYQKDSSNIDKLDKWQDAQQRTSEIESEMYEHLSQMQQYYNDLEYGTSNEIDKELDAWYNFMDKLSISEGASGAEVTALDRIFGENASEEIQLIKEQILDSVAAGDDFDFDSAINGSQALKNTLQYVGLTAEDVKNYFTQIGEASKIATNNITPVKTYSVLLEDAENYNEILSQTSEIVSNNTKVTQEYKDSLLELGISSDELNECFDENNKLVVKDAKALNELVKSAKKNTAQNIRLAKSQAKLEYYELYKEIKRLTNGQRVNDQATLDQINSLYAQMTAVQKTIAKYSLLEATLLGSANAYTKLAEAQEMDEISDYGTKAEELVNVLAEAFNTSKLGTEAAQVAIAGLIPDEVFAEADTLDDKMQKIYEYFTGGKVSKLFTIEFD